VKITCHPEKGGCGQKWELSEVEATFREHAQNNTTMPCMNTDCRRVVTVQELHQFVAALDKLQAKQQQPPAVRWPGFPLARPVVPEGRRKNGARPGICFKQIGDEPLDRPPTQDEIRRVQRFFAQSLDGGTDCPCCTRHARRQHRALGCGPARWLIEIVFLSDKGQPIHTGTVLKALKGNNISGSDATSVLPLYGLIEPAEDPQVADNPPPPSSRAYAKGRTSGFWAPTELGRSFALDRVKVPERVVTCLGVPESFEGDLVSIKDALGKKFNYDEIMGRTGAA
jgi:hypothetical protein